MEGGGDGGLGCDRPGVPHGQHGGGTWWWFRGMHDGGHVYHDYLGVGEVSEGEGSGVVVDQDDQSPHAQYHLLGYHFLTQYYHLLL